MKRSRKIDLLAVHEAAHAGLPTLACCIASIKPDFDAGSAGDAVTEDPCNCLGGWKKCGRIGDSDTTGWYARIISYMMADGKITMPRLGAIGAWCREVAILVSVLACVASSFLGIDNVRAEPVIDHQVSITSDKAKQIVAAAEAEAKKRGWKMCIAVVDATGELAYFLRMDGAPIDSVTVSQRKARTAARYRRPTQTFYDAYGMGPRLTRIIAAVTNLDPALVVLPGGFPLVEGDNLIGGVGCSGGTVDQDTLICNFGMDLVK
jgi:glc operon protein GlcG